MREVRVFKNEDTMFEVEFDSEQLIKVRDKIIDKMSVIDHYRTASPESPYYSPNNSAIKGRKDIQIRYYREWYEPWIDVWDLYCSSYDRYVIPYIAVLIDDVLEGKYEAVVEIKELNCGKEYIPICQTIEEYTKIIAKHKEYHVKFPVSPLCHQAEARVAAKNIKKYIDIMLDDRYADKFRQYYEMVSQMISVRELDEETKEQEQAGFKRKHVLTK